VVSIEGRRFELLHLPRARQGEIPLLLLLERAETAKASLPPMLLARLTDEARAELSFGGSSSASGPSSGSDSRAASDEVSEQSS
jgi:hypothetical protein